MKKHVSQYHSPSRTRRQTRALLPAAGAVLLAGAANLAPPLAPSALADDAKVAALEARVAELDQQVRILARKAELASEQAAKDGAKAPVVTAGTSGLTVAAKDKSYSFTLSPLIQADYRSYLSDAAAGTAQDSFLLRRVRLDFKGTVGSVFSFRLTPEFSSADTAGNNTSISYAWIAASVVPAFNLKAGKVLPAITVSAPDDRHFVEATYTNQLAPNRDIGVEAFGKVAAAGFSYRLGLYNGAANTSWAEIGNDTVTGDFTLAGRATFEPFSRSDNELLSPLTLSVGFSYGHEENKSNNGRVRTPNQQNVIVRAYGPGNHLRLAPAVEWYWEQTSVVAELLWERWDLAAGGSVDNLGWRVTGGYVLTGEKTTRGGVTPSSPFNFGKGGWGAVELVARVSGVRIGDTPGRSDRTSAVSVGVGANWYLTKNILWRLDLEGTDFDRKAALRRDELALFSRLQIKF
ncbi:MAG: OprO/OprP family phosphate-selective porin [Puniceicoccales bacterium]|jgi:phosphate-selective porin OprO/OprP|nr:OprO/OprP family phosphate-selective porin [Puniceicoccales bacterium]